MTLSEKAILATLHYHDIFDFPLSEKEMLTLLISRRKFTKQKLNQSLKKLIIKKKIETTHGFFYIPSRNCLIKKRLNKINDNNFKIEIARKTANIISKIPWIKMIAVTGTLAMKNAEENDDIDILIVAQEKRMWLARFSTILVLEILRQRRRPNDLNSLAAGRQAKNKICLNVLLNKSNLRLPKKKQNLFIAHEIKQMNVLINKEKTYEEFLSKNEWLNKYFANTKKLRKIKYNRINTFGMINRILNAFDFLLFLIQSLIMSNKKTKEIVSYQFAFFHPNDLTKKILSNFYLKLSDYD